MNLENKKFIIVSGPVVIEESKVLLNHKKDQAWQFIGGKVTDNDEIDENTLENVCKREVKEEMGIDVKIICPLKPMMIRHPDKKDTIVILIHFLAKRIGKIKPSKEIEEYKWFNIDKLPKNCAPNIKPVIEEYRNQLIRK